MLFLVFFSGALPAALAIAPVPIEVPITAASKTALVSAVVRTIPKAHLKIPSIGVNAVIEDVGLTGDGAMAVPDNGVDVGLFSLGTHPGNTGSAVIGGHNRWDSKAAVFGRLDQLKEGDIVLVVDPKGIETSFVVRDIRTFDAMDTDTGIFSSESGAHLNLITCSGEWNSATQDYTKRLVIFTDAM